MTIVFDPTSVDEVIELVTGSDNLQDLCRKIVHSDLSAGLVKGAHLYLLDSKSNFLETAGYGIGESSDSEFSAWGESVEAEAIRSKELVSNGRQSSVPLIKDSIPIGCLTLWHTNDLKESPIPHEIAIALGKLVAFFVETHNVGTSAKSASRAVGSVEDMTTRQSQILNLIADGLTNAEIALKVMLSESTVRQETIRIYRALGVGSRQEAVAKGRALGLIAKIAPSQN